MNIEIGKKALVTTSEWFYAPDGAVYRAVFGTVRGVMSAAETLGIKPKAGDASWFLEIGNMTIAGCQIKYAIRTDKCNDSVASGWSASAEGGFKSYMHPCSIYFADGEGA